MSRIYSFVLIFLVFLLPNTSFAEVQTANDIDISVSPFRFELSGDSGDVIEREITLFNNTDQTRVILLSREDFLSNNTTGVPQFYAQ
ncbi:hypothetical protein H6769_05480 [Candidatus Peribacteria bacterium]|nr:hypothetical protein [Candidatus Peribacteria bacterium]